MHEVQESFLIKDLECWVHCQKMELSASPPHRLWKVLSRAVADSRRARTYVVARFCNWFYERKPKLLTSAKSQIFRSW